MPIYYCLFYLLLTEIKQANFNLEMTWPTFFHVIGLLRNLVAEEWVSYYKPNLIVSHSNLYPRELIKNVFEIWLVHSGTKTPKISSSHLKWWNTYLNGEVLHVIWNRTCAARSFDFEITRMISAQIALHSVQLPLFSTPILISLLVPVIWLALIGAIYSWIVSFFALTHIFFPASEEASLKNKKTNQISRFTKKQLIKLQENERQWVSWGKFCNFCFQNSYLFPPKMDEFYFKPAQYCIELTKSCTWAISKWMKSRVWFQPKLHSTQFNYHY